MKVILQDSVLKLGKAGDIVEAKPGYFRNFLQPRGLAVTASKGTLKKREEDLEMLKKKAEKVHGELVALGDKISAIVSMTIKVKSGDNGKLYGKITHQEIADLIEKEVGVAIDKRVIKVNQDITAVGAYKATIKLAPDVVSELDIDVVAENAHQIAAI
ncbi:MAG: 50S ribosomal protein L9 [Candidatus Obscuribacter sp.]|nr:50S ribosomal protein L9 [Candidatus Obscuribacter sp.]